MSFQVATWDPAWVKGPHPLSRCTAWTTAASPGRGCPQGVTPCTTVTFNRRPTPLGGQGDPTATCTTLLRTIGGQSTTPSTTTQPVGARGLRATRQGWVLGRAAVTKGPATWAQPGHFRLCLQ